MESSNPGLSFAAQPAALTIAVSFTESAKPHLTVFRFDYSGVRGILLDVSVLGRKLAPSAPIMFLSECAVGLHPHLFFPRCNIALAWSYSNEETAGDAWRIQR
jgi:hypothetical protein